MVLRHASTSLTTEGRQLRVHSISTSVKRNPAGISNNILMTSLLSQRTLRSSNFPPNLPLRTVPNPSNSVLSTGIRGPRNDKSSKFGSSAIMSRISARVTPLVPMVKEVTDSGNLQTEGILNSGTFPHPNRYILRTFVNDRMCSKNSSGAQSGPPTQMRKIRAWWAGPCSGTGKVLSHLSTRFEVKSTVWKRYRRHDGVHDFDTRAHGWRELTPASVARQFKISSMISCGILGTITVLTSTGAGGSSIKGFEPVPCAGREGSGKFCFGVGRSPFEGVEPIRGVGRGCRFELERLGSCSLRKFPIRRRRCVAVHVFSLMTSGCSRRPLPALNLMVPPHNALVLNDNINLPDTEGMSLVLARGVLEIAQRFM